MKIEFHKRTKNQNKVDLGEKIATEDPEPEDREAAPPKKPVLQFTARFLDRSHQHVHGSGQVNPLSRKFEQQKQGGLDISSVIQEKRDELERLEGKLAGSEPKSENNHRVLDIVSEKNDPQNVYLSKLLEYEQRIMKEQNEKPLWSAGITEVDISQASRIENIQKCESLLFDNLRSMVRAKLFRKENLLIPDEDIIAKGGIWAKPKKLVVAEEDIKKKIKKSLSSVFGKQKKAVSFGPSAKLKIE